MYQINCKDYPKVVEQLDKLDLSVIKNKGVDQLSKLQQANLVYALISDDFDIFLEALVEMQAHQILDDIEMVLDPQSSVREGAYWAFMARMFKACNSYLSVIFESYKDAYFEEYPDLRPMSDYDDFRHADRRAA